LLFDFVVSTSSSPSPSLSEHFFDLGLGDCSDFGLTADPAIENLGNVNVVTDDDEHCWDAILPGSGLLDVFEPFEPLAGDLLQRALRFTMDDLWLGLSRPPGQ
jgi:hypothetical protein